MTMSFHLDPMLKQDKSTARLEEPNINLMDSVNVNFMQVTKSVNHQKKKNWISNS